MKQHPWRLPTRCQQHALPHRDHQHVSGHCQTSPGTKVLRLTTVLEDENKECVKHNEKSINNRKSPKRKRGAGADEHKWSRREDPSLWRDQVL